MSSLRIPFNTETPSPRRHRLQPCQHPTSCVLWPNHPSNWPAVACFALLLTLKEFHCFEETATTQLPRSFQNELQIANPDQRISGHRATAPPTMDLDIEMDVDDIHEAPISAVPQAYTHDIITGEEQVRIGGSLPGPPKARR